MSDLLADSRARRAVGAPAAELRALTVLGVDLAYLGRGDQGPAQLWPALQLDDGSADPMALGAATPCSG